MLAPIQSISVLLVGPELVVSGLQRLLESQRPRVHVVNMATDCARGLQIAHRTVPNVVVLDVDISEDLAAAVPAFVNGHGTRVLILAGPREAKAGEASILRGASGLVQRSDSPETFMRAIEKVSQGELWLDRGTTGRLFVELSRARSSEERDPERRKISSLTLREREIVVRLAADPGADNRSLAGKLYIGEHTLRNHLSRIYDKLGVPNRTQLYAYARRHGLTPAS